MPLYTIAERNIDFNRHSLLLDTNVLVAAFYETDENHDTAKFFIDETDYQLLISAAVIIETWGMLVGARKARMQGNQFLQWINTPGKPIIILPQQGECSIERDLVSSLRIDYVDVTLARLANDITIQCQLEKALAIATYDTKDYYSLRYSGNLRLNIHDMTTDALQELD